MNITLQNFESAIDPQILSRGKSYYRKGAVVKLEQDGESWHAMVVGNDEYTVDVAVDQGEIVDYNCTCPYDFGPLCKHEVAVFYAMRDGFKQIKTKKVKKIVPAPISNKNSQTADILQSVTHAQLIDFVTELSTQSADIQRQVLLRFGQTTLDKKTLIGLIKQALHQATDCHGFLDYWSAGQAAENVWVYLEEAELMIKQQKYSAIVPYYQAVIEVVVPALQQADDSNGELGGLIETSFEKLTDLAPKLPPNDRDELFLYCLTESRSAKYDGWSDWQIQWLRIAALLIAVSSQQSQLFKTLDELVASESRIDHGQILDKHFKPNKKLSIFDEVDSYLAQETALLKYQVIVKRQGKEAGFHFLLENQAMSNIKKELIKYWITLPDFDKAKQLAKEAYDHYLTSLPGLAIDFAKQLVVIAERQHDYSALIKWGTTVFLGWGDFDYFNQMKQALDPQSWLTVVDNLLKETGSKSKHPHAGLYVKAKILSQENRLADLYDLIVSNPEGYSLLSEYESILKANYPEGIAKIYEAEINQKLQSFGLGRSLYQDVCRMLRRIKKLGFPEKVRVISHQLQTKYPNRPALLDELNRV
ncbi:MAG: SWIM zinc finger family protein [Patescibacteria group bacterium]|nr:SWIM zinc finger family protein [Patescibacteria group bacterium]